MVIGRVLVGEGNHDAGIVRMLDAMRTLRETGGELIYSYALNLLAESYLKGREPEKGLAAIAEALKGIETSGQHIHEAELWRLRGELLVLRSDAQAEATSFARFLGRHGRPDEAKSKLAPIVASITEGFEDTDFKEATALLGELG
jgi:hypothetical protein